MYSKLSREELIQLREIFTDAKDWPEVSKIQYVIECLPPEPKPIIFEGWFQYLIQKDFFDYILSVPTEYVADMIQVALEMESTIRNQK